MIVVDANVAVKWVLTDEVDADKAAALAERCGVQAEPMVAPPLLLSEVTNILRQQMRRTGLPLASARPLLVDFLAFPLVLTEPAGLYDQALQVADRYNLPAAYDAQYVALAQHLGCDLWTADQRLLDLLGGALPFVKSLSTYSP
jgi:predicted nucleic acid-binding protein